MSHIECEVEQSLEYATMHISF